jgi:DNA-binding response OmpR family regulator
VRAEILLAEDDAITARFLITLLESDGYRVRWADDGRKAVAEARRERPDLLLTDLVMPYRDGYQVIREIRDDHRLRHLPIILMSLKDREEDIVRGLNEGADDYVVKPFRARELLTRIRKRIEATRGATG